MRTLSGKSRDRGGTGCARRLRAVHGPRDEVRRHDADDAVAELYATDWSSLVRLGWLLGCDEHAAEEIVQGAFIEVHRRWDSLRSRESATGYLRRSVVNGARSSSHATSAKNHAPSPETRSSMIMALWRLPERQKEVMIMRYYLDLRDVEIADALGISAASVQAHGDRGVVAMHGQMETAS